MSRPPRAQFARARGGEERARRRAEILDSARTLLAHGDYAAVTMSRLAEEAGLAKGTAYLYFPTKEALILELLLVDLEGWTAALVQALPSADGPDAVARVFAGTLVARPLLVDLLARLHLTLEANLDDEGALAFKERLAELTAPAAGALAAALGLASPADGLRLLLHAHALVVGLSQMAAPSPPVARALARPHLQAMNVTLPEDLEVALGALFRGMVHPSPP